MRGNPSLRPLIMIFALGMTIPSGVPGYVPIHSPPGVVIHGSGSLPQDQTVIALQAVSSGIAFVAVESNPTLGGNGAASVYRTVDGGRVWRRIAETVVGGQRNLFWLRFFTAHDGYLLVNGRSLWRTSNGGVSWEKTPLPSVTTREDISFPTFAQGWVLQQGAAASGIQSIHVLHTRDGGRKWTRIASTAQSSSDSLPLAGLKLGISFPDVKRGWMNGAWNTLGATWLYDSRDGGRRWNSIRIPLPASLKSSELCVSVPRISAAGFGLLPLGAASR